MEEIATATLKIACPFCKAQIDPTAYFCPDCGKKVREKPLSTGFGSQALLYLASIFLPPFNLPWTWRYLHSDDPTGKKIGWISVILMVISLLIVIWLSYAFAQSLTKQIAEQMKIYQNLGF
jgi:hypothetical protein